MKVGKSNKLGSIETPDIPCIIYEESSLRDRYESLTTFLDSQYPNYHLLYALKACYVPPVVTTLIQLGCGVEVMSLNERLLLNQLSLSDIAKSTVVVWNGPSLNAESLQFAIEKGEHINVDSPHIFNAIEQLCDTLQTSVCVSLRINVSGGGRLGMDPNDAEKLLQSSSKLVSIEGFHIHYGPMSVIGQMWVDARLAFLDLLHRWEQKFGITVRRVNFGGGLPSPENLSETITPLIARLSSLRAIPILYLEPGAFLVEQAGTAFARVIAVKHLAETNWASLDIGGNILIPLQRTKLAVDFTEMDKAEGLLNFGGALCYEADIIGSISGYRVEPGQIIRVKRAGAYTTSMASCFGSTPPPIYWRDHSGALQKIERIIEGKKLFIGYHGYPLMSGSLNGT